MTDYVTKDSGERAEFDSGMQRDTQTGKPRFDLTWPDGVPYEEQLLVRFAELMARGAEKYTERNWEKASGPEELARFKASAFRHFMQWYGGDRSEDHAVAIFFNVMGFEATSYKMSKADDDAANDERTAIFLARQEEEIAAALGEFGQPPAPSADACAIKPVFADQPSISLRDKEGDWWYFDHDADAWVLEANGTPSSYYTGFEAVFEIIENHGAKKKSKPIARPTIEVHLNSATPQQVVRSVCTALHSARTRSVGARRR